MDKSNIHRIKHLLAGDHSHSNFLQSGYKKKITDYKEGDIWEENDKQWTIKDGIKQTVSKLDFYRQLNKMPFICPECNRPMNKNLDKKMWVLKHKCSDCVIEEDTNRIIKGTFKEYEQEEIRKSKKSWLKDVTNGINELIQNNYAQHIVTEQGDIETWDDGTDKKVIKKDAIDHLEEFEKNV